MLPILLSLGPVKIYAFGVFMAFGLLFGTFAAWKKISEYHIEAYEFFDGVINITMWGLVLGRLVYVLEHWGVFSQKLLRILLVFGYPGLSMWGAILGVIGALYWWSRGVKDKMVWFDLLAIGGTVGLAIGRLGTLLNGSSVGLKTDGWWGVMVVGVEGKVWPVQLLEAVFLFVVFLLLWKWERIYRTFEWYRAGKSYARTGFLFFMGIFLLGIIFLLSSFLYQTEGVQKVLNLIWPGACVLAGVVGLYTRSGRSLETDLGTILGNKKRL